MRVTATLLTVPRAAQLHNALIISLFDPSTHKVAAITPPPEVQKGPARKRRRLLPYQGEDDDDLTSLRSERLKQWVIGVGKRERERIRSLQNEAFSFEREPNPDMDGIARERAAYLPPERGGMLLASHFALCLMLYRRPCGQSTIRAASFVGAWLHTQPCNRPNKSHLRAKQHAAASQNRVRPVITCVRGLCSIFVREDVNDVTV
jgi:hypothetical protein